MSNECVRCGRPIADGYACQHCGVVKPTAQLAQIADMTPAARDVAHGLSRRGGGGTSGKPGSRLPLDLAATAKLDGVQAELTTWARHIAEERGGRTIRHGVADPIIHATQYLAANLEWLRHRPEVDEVLTDIQAAARVVAGIARGPAAQRFLGPCGAERKHGDSCAGGAAWCLNTCDCWCHQAESDTCEGDVYAREGASNGSCRLCGAQVSTRERQAWLDAEVRSRAFRAAEIASAYGINVKTIRGWADRGLLHEHGQDRDGRPLYLVGDVLDLAVAAAARRAENEAKRARREDAEVGA